MKKHAQPVALVMFSGGLDSILAAKLLEEQDVRVICLHFYTPFFGKPQAVNRWKSLYDLDIRAVDLAEEYVAMLARRPVYGFGSVLNPCVDCKILMLARARDYMEETGACVIATGEVLGQRPMSQRRDTLNVIRRDAGLKGLLLRPLTAQHLDPTDAELAGLIDRSRLLGLSGRGRKGQMELAARFGLREIPTPAGGCRLAEQENARSYWPVLRHLAVPRAGDFYLANAGRQFWNETSEPRWLVIGRKQAENDELMRLAKAEDVLFKVREFPGPLALARCTGAPWTEAQIAEAAAFMASYSPKAARHAGESGGLVAVRVHRASLDAPGTVVEVVPQRCAAAGWREYGWPEAREGIKEEAKTKSAVRCEEHEPHGAAVDKPSGTQA